MKAKIEKLPKSTIKMEVVVPTDKVKEEYELALDTLVKTAELPGFRKGMAPKALVQEKTDVSKLYGDVINNLLQKYYTQAIKENLINPVANPKVEIKEFDLEKDFEFTATIAIRPDVEIKNIDKIKASIKKTYENKIAEEKKANEERLKKGEEVKEVHVHLHAHEVIDAILAESKIEISDLLVDEETDRMMERLAQQAQAIGISMDQYLKAQNKTSEELKTDYAKSAETNLKAEFVLAKLIKDMNIEVTDQELQETLSATGDTSTLESLNDPVQKWYIKSILEKNKLLNKFMEEAEGENYHGHH
jgi:trigger factor